MGAKAQMALDLLELELEIINKEQQRSFLGGELEWGKDSNGNYYYREQGSQDWTAYGYLNEVTITPTSNYTNPYTIGSSNGYNPYSSGNSNGSASGGGSGNDPSGTPNGGGLGSHLANAQDAMSLAIGHALAWKEGYAFANSAFQGEVTANTLLASILDKTPLQSLVDDVSLQNFKGIAIVNAAGRVLGVTSAATSMYNLYWELTDNKPGVSNLVIADAVISVGSLVVKSNVVGFAISAGWLLIKGNFEEK